MTRPRAVRDLFETIEPSYDRFTRRFSFGMDRRWKRVVRRLAADHAPGPRHVDLATGTGDLLFDATSVGLDFAPAMLRAARRRRPAARVGVADMLRLPLGDGTVDVLTAAYGFRNVEDADRALREARRVLVPGGALVVLDFFRPRLFPWRVAFETYLDLAGRTAGLLAHRNAATYGYIAWSLRRWCTLEAFAARAAAAGLRRCGGRSFLGGGIAVLAFRASAGPGAPTT